MKVCGTSKGNRPRKLTWWWNEEVSKSVKAKRNAFKLFKKGLGTAEAYKTAKKEASRCIYQAKRAAEVKQFGNLCTNKSSRDNIFKMARQTRHENQDVVGDPCIVMDNGELAFNVSDKLSAWKEQYETLLNEEFEWN